MTSLSYSDELHNYLIINNNNIYNNDLNNNDVNNNDVNNNNVNNNFNSYIIDNNNNDNNNNDNNDNTNNNERRFYNIEGFDNRNISEKNDLREIIKYNRIMNMLNFLLSNRSTFEKVVFIEENYILKKNNNIFNEDFDFFKNDF
jgi:hypothetical protein